VDGSDVFVCTNLGVVACVDAPTGRVRWLSGYPALERFASRSPNRDLRRDVHFVNRAPQLRDGRLLVMPLDSTEMQLLDPATGRTLRSLRTPGEHGSRHDALLLPGHLLLLAGDSDLEGLGLYGRYQGDWRVPIGSPARTELIGALSHDEHHVYVPLNEGLVVFSPHERAVVTTLPWDGALARGGARRVVPAELGLVATDANTVYASVDVDAALAAVFAGAESGRDALLAADLLAAAGRPEEAAQRYDTVLAAGRPQDLARAAAGRIAAELELARAADTPEAWEALLRQAERLGDLWARAPEALSALLALGATGSMRAVHELLSIAEDGLVGGRKVSGDSRPLALLSLGIARRRGVAESVDTFLANWATAAGDNSLRAQNVREAALIALDLARSPAATEDADTHLAGKGDGAALTSRLLETMGRAGDPSHVPALLNQAGSVDLERRRAAAIALSGFDSPLLAGALMTAFEVETEPLARGFLLLSLAEQSGDAARDFLVAALHDGPAECRPWAALALGAHARREGDESSRAVLREGLRDAGEAQGARVLACGLARDPLALSPLGDLLAESANPRVRMFAALSMAMIGGDAASAVLRERLGVETSPLARVGLAQALGVLGHGEDVEALLHEVRSVSSPTLAAQLATAIGFHGSERAAAGLVEVLADRDTSAATRAAALDGLALLLDRNEPLLLAQAGAQRNFMALSDWLREVLPTSTL